MAGKPGRHCLNALKVRSRQDNDVYTKVKPDDLQIGSHVRVYGYNIAITLPTMYYYGLASWLPLRAFESSAEATSRTTARSLPGNMFTCFLPRFLGRGSEFRSA